MINNLRGATVTISILRDPPQGFMDYETNPGRFYDGEIVVTPISVTVRIDGSLGLTDHSRYFFYQW